MSAYEWFAMIGGVTVLLSLAWAMWKITSH